MPKVILTGSQGFIGSYVCRELLNKGYEVIGVDDYSKYGKITRAHDKDSGFRFIEADLSERSFSEEILKDDYKDSVDYIIAGAAMVGGVSYLDKYIYDVLSTNERITANTFDLAIEAFKRHKLKKIIVLSSGLVYENSSVFPTPEIEAKLSAPPSATYGLQKLASEYFAKGAYKQYGLPYTIIRPFNCIGTGEEDSIKENETTSGNIKLAMSHVVPDLINKILKGQYPLHILGSGEQVRCYINGKDMARGIRLAMEHDNAFNQDFNISSREPTSVLELAKLIWKKIKGNEEFKYVSDEPFSQDVQKSIPSVDKASVMIGFEAEISLEESLEEVIEHIKNKT